MIVRRRGLSLFASAPGVGVFDAVLAAAALDADAAGLVSADRAFGGIEGLPHVFPDIASIAALLA